jgi:hypothetical protein
MTKTRNASTIATIINDMYKQSILVSPTRLVVVPGGTITPERHSRSFRVAYTCLTLTFLSNSRGRVARSFAASTRRLGFLFHNTSYRPYYRMHRLNTVPAVADECSMLSVSNTICYYCWESVVEAVSFDETCRGFWDVRSLI